MLKSGNYAIIIHADAYNVRARKPTYIQRSRR